MKRSRLIGCLLALLLCALGTVYWVLTSGPPPLRGEDSLEAAPSTGKHDPESEQEKIRRRMFGVWHDKSQADRLLTMTLKEDGTGTMLVEMSGLNRILMGPELRFKLKWWYDGEKLSTRLLGGEPADKVNVILNTRDTAGDNTILEHSDERLLLLDKDGKTRYDWRRREAEPRSDK